MNRRAFVLVVAVSLSAVAVGTGCMPTMTIEEMKAMMPSRPAELDQLNAFVGTWDHTGTATMMGMEEPFTSTGRTTVKWEGDGWYVIESGSYAMEGFDPMKMNAVWAYDSRAKVFRSNWVDSMGSFGIGKMRYNERTDTWHMKAKSHSPFGTSTGKGTLKFLDADTQEWVWAEYALGGLIKTMEMKSTAKRQR